MTTAKLADLSVTDAKIAANACTSAKINAGAVTQQAIAGDAVRISKIRTTETSLAGSVLGNGTVDILFGTRTFIPMIHVADQVKVELTGHSVDGVGADQARMGLHNDTAGSETYDIDYRAVTA